MISIDQFCSGGVEVQLCAGSGAFRNSIPVIALLVYAVVVHLLVIYKQQFRTHLKYFCNSVKNGTICTPQWILHCENIIVAFLGK